MVKKKKFDLKEKYRQFKAWQVRPREVAPMSQDEHECLNCHDHYTGSFCPRCGQPATTTRFSWKVAVASFIDAYGLGERGMFRTMGNLLLRPGYLILDYLRGMRASYFAPFKMYFLLFAVSLLVTHGLNIKGENFSFSDDFESAVQEVKEEEQAEARQVVEIDLSGIGEKENPESNRIKEILYGVFDKAVLFAKNYPAMNILLLLVMMSGILFFFFRRSPNIPDLRYSEFFVMLLYTTNMYTIYSIVFDFFCLGRLSSYAFFLTLIPLKQFSGYSWWRTILKFTVAFVTIFVLFILFIIFGVLLVGVCVKKFG
ncbi:MAG: DUF3667 domain-containing protein [Bacteroidales bacterium]|nr:DUF3667 domain-containing protein [Bacteroidales bacterium]